MANVPRKGFYPVDAYRFQPRRYTVASAYTPANSHPGIAPGEVVEIVAAGTVQVAAAGSVAILGVVASVRYYDTSGTEVTGGYIPAGLTFTGGDTIANPKAPVIEVWDDPLIEYIATVAGSATTLATFAAGTGQNMDLSATASTGVDTIFKRSNRTLDGTLIAAGTSGNFIIRELFRQPGYEYASTNYRAICMINEHYTRVGTVGV